MKREQWRFVGRENHYGDTWLVWELVAHPRGIYRVGKRYVVKL